MSTLQCSVEEMVIIYNSRSILPYYFRQDIGFIREIEYNRKQKWLLAVQLGKVNAVKYHRAVTPHCQVVGCRGLKVSLVKAKARRLFIYKGAPLRPEICGQTI